MGWSSSTLRRATRSPPRSTRWRCCWRSPVRSRRPRRHCARGGIIDEGALQRALEAGIVAGAALDVFSEEPPPWDLPLLKDERVVVTPHLGASTEEAQVNVALDVAEEILTVLDGRPPR